jgi:hypothetical protein
VELDEEARKTRRVPLGVLEEDEELLLEVVEDEDELPLGVAGETHLKYPSCLARRKSSTSPRGWSSKRRFQMTRPYRTEAR